MTVPQNKGSKAESLALQPNASVSRLNGQAGLARQVINSLPSKYDSDIVVRLFDDMVARGKNHALESGVLEKKAEELQPGIEHAQAIAKDSYRELFAPTSEQRADQLYEEEHLKVQAERKEAILMEKHAEANLADLEERLAHAQPSGRPPQPPAPSFKAAAVVVIAITVAATLHDQVFRFRDEITAWLFSLLAGLLCGWFVVSMILYRSEGSAHSQTDKQRNWIGVVAGIVFGLAFLGVRISQADDESENTFTIWMLALGMSVLEIAAVIGLHAIVEHFRQAQQKWLELVQPAEQIARNIEVAKSQLETCRQRRKELDEAVEQYIRYVGERQVRHNHTKEIEDLIVKGYEDGYAQGVAINLGRIRRVRKGEDK